MIRVRIPVVLFSAVALAGCDMASPYMRPVVELPAFFVVW